MVSFLARKFFPQQSQAFIISATTVHHLSTDSVVAIFDRHAKRIQRNRACSVDNPRLYDYLKDAIAGQIIDRVCDVAR